MQGNNALMMACQEGHLEVVKELLQAGGGFNFYNNKVFHHLSMALFCNL